jgi:paraquat-inducible protein A
VEPPGGGKLSRQAVTARELGLTTCHACRLLVKLHPEHHHVHASCPRCGEALHLRKTNSLARTWALLIAAVILYVPANVLPFSIITTFGASEPDTIMSGVIYFIHSGEWPIAAVIFTASIFVPILKLIIITFLLLSIHFKSHWRPNERMRLYRIIEGIGRWSMVDIYVVTIMAALVHMGSLADFTAGPGAVFFAGVVVLTILASMSFDPRLIWDAME